MGSADRAADEAEERSQRSGTRKLKALDTCGPYELIHALDVGGMGEVFLARKRGDATLAAVKRLLPHMVNNATFAGMFLDEARLAAKLSHPNICGVQEVGEKSGLLYIAMDFVHGTSLKQLLRHPSSGGKLPIPIIARIVADVAAALDYAHGLKDASGPLGIVHRDVSPPNIMIGYDGRVRLLDFGMAKAQTQAHKTLSGFVKGKFGYLAPEQVGEKPLDSRTDIFALGLCLFEGLVGRQLFDQPNPAMTVAAIREFQRPPSVREMRREIEIPLEDVVDRALARDPAERFATGAAFRNAVLAAVPDIASPSDVAAFVDRLYPERERATELGLSALMIPSEPPAAPERAKARVSSRPPPGEAAKTKVAVRAMLTVTVLVVAATIAVLLSQ